MVEALLNYFKPELPEWTLCDEPNAKRENPQ